MNVLIEHLLGWISILLIFFFVLIFAKKNSHIKKILLIAFFIRATMIILEQYGILILPDGNSIDSDATRFELIARLWSSGTMFPFGGAQEEYPQLGLSVLLDFFKSDSLLISRVISIFYTIFGESIMMAKSISLALALSSIYISYLLCLEIYGEKSAIITAFIVALFPTHILYSVITLREMYVVFFLIISLSGIVKFIKKKSFSAFLQIFIGFYITSLFHGPVVIGFFIFLIYLIIEMSYKEILELKKLKVNIFPILIIILFFIPIILFTNNYIAIPYIGNYEILTDFDYLFYKANIGFHGSAVYPSWLSINNIYELFPKLIIKVIYFLYSPFIWDIKQFSHIVGLFDGILYIVLTIFLICNINSIWTNPLTRILLLIFISYLIIYGLGVGNFGTAIRHRSKFLIILIILASPKIHKLIILFKKKIYK